MARVNVAVRNKLFTHEGAPAHPASAKPINALRRSVLSCLLWEDNFYESGKAIADRIMELADQVTLNELAALAYEARHSMHLRHVPLLLLVALAKRGSGHPSGGVATVTHDIISRADEMAELIALYNKYNPKKMIPAAMRRGLARAITKFDEYQLAKYDRPGAVKLRTVFRLARPKPANEKQRQLWGRAVKGELKTPDTWEVELSAGKDKKETFERLIKEGKLGYLALLRNLRNMKQSGCDLFLVKAAIAERKGAHRVLPFRFIAAARHAPEFEPDLDAAMLVNLAQQPKMPGRTLIVVDVSGSMGAKLSSKSEMARWDVAAALAVVCREICTEAAIYATAGSDGYRTHKTAQVPARRGMPLVSGIIEMCYPLGGGGIFLNQVCQYLKAQGEKCDRMIVITDEQDCGISGRDSPLNAEPLGSRSNYLINVAAHKNGIGYGKWTHIDGFSENVIRYIMESEAEGV